MNAMEMSKHDHVLFALISQYQTLAMVGLGKIQNPASGETERDLDQARAFIDVLEMFKVKCRQDTPDQLLRLLDAAVMDLQLNYVDELKKDRKHEAEAKEESGEAEPEDAAGEAADEPGSADEGETT
ncbi:DUF1844 domain-containing protein [bacterium]|nr:DUF1844 domain-containing protein [bacterium]